MPSSDAEFNLYFIRHGESESNVTPDLAAGKNWDAPMTERGHRQALALGSGPSAKESRSNGSTLRH